MQEKTIIKAPKKKVLMVSEYHGLKSGFGTYSKQVLERLSATGKYEIAEFAIYGRYSQIENSQWLVYANAPEEGEPNSEAYGQHPVNQFGAWRFEKVLLDFKPDIVLCYRDPWMDSFIEKSPLRDFFHWVWMPTVDSAPQKREWLHTFAECDAVLCYSEYGERVLANQSLSNINVIGTASPGIDPKLYKPVPNKAKHREELGIRPDVFIAGTVMRNQKRKLFIELMKSFRIFLDNAPKEVADRSYLYLHTSYPEKMGWDLSEGAITTGLSGKILTTYICRNCGQWFPAFFNDALTKCKFCKNPSAVMPNVGIGLSIPDLIKVYNLFDLYIQYAICEGFGMPQVEAAACGVPVAAVDYSAMEDVVRYTKGFPIRVKSLARELETNADRAIPDNEHLAEILKIQANAPDYKKQKLSLSARQGAVKRYDWDDTAKVWEKYIDSYTPVGLQGRWDAPRRQMVQSLPASVPPNLDHQQFITWLNSTLTKDSSKTFGIESSKIVKELSLGATFQFGQISPIKQEDVFNRFKQKAINDVQVERIRIGELKINQDRFILEAHNRKAK